ncbi:flippase [Clostridium sp. SYSU_GA19001]|uniref:flippase n=1 Tax=Clostridium caldaquaticum TaxID=2940653 RepID=UPI00207719CB|nr:flippase [Clostridium caldaquaticum]MCM8709408.1 flippase [Clostridium caldaquaticum]
MMRQKSLIKNYVYNVSLTLLNMLFPIITFPYVSRVIGAVGVGKVSYATSIVNIFLIFASLGIPVYGVREIAKARDNKIKLSKVFSEIFLINTIAGIVSSVVYYTAVLSLDYFWNERILFLLLGSLLILNIFSIDWMYQGLENYGFITIRSIMFKIISIVLLFLLVQNRGDYIIYGAISVIALSGANIVNIINSRKYIKIGFKNLDFKRHLKPILILFSSQVATNIYINLDSAMLGIISGDKYVGYYSAALKINRMVLGIVTSLGVVLLPRLAYYIKQDMKENFNILIEKSVQFILFLGLPSCVGLYALAPQIIRLFSGDEFIPAVPTMQITVFIIILIGLSNLTGIQILMPLGKERKLLISVIVGAVVDFILNLILIPIFNQNGTAIAFTIAEFLVLAIQLKYTKNYMKRKIINKKNVHYLIGSIFVFIAVELVKLLNLSDIFTILLSIVFSGSLYFVYCLIVGESIIQEILNKSGLR